jgi:hypothetical protein
MAAKKELTRADIISMADYAARRPDLRREITEVKRDRRMAVGPHATFYFESYQTMWHQVHEMLHIEKGGDDQIAGELEAYNPLIPKGNELVTTVMFEISDPDRRARVLAGLGGVESTITIAVDDAVVAGEAEEDADRTDEFGKASSVQFVRFRFTPAQIARFRAPEARIVVAIGHPNYAHMAVMPDAVRNALAEDFD